MNSKDTKSAVNWAVAVPLLALLATGCSETTTGPPIENLPWEDFKSKLDKVAPIREDLPLFNDLEVGTK